MSSQAWWQRGAIYQVYPRSFADADGDGIGDLRGIMEHLDHLSDLEVAAVWLSPINRSPMADFGYDVADYYDVDPLFGTRPDLDRLVQDCHARGIRVILDWVPNHTSDQHPWFVASRSSRNDPKRDWYVWRDGRDGGPPNDWRSTFDKVGPAWTFDERTGQWYLHSFLPQQPDLNWDNLEVEGTMHDVLRYWLDRDVDGFRVDVVQKIAKDPLLRDNAGAARRHDEDWDTIRDRLRGIRRVIDEYPDRVLIGEVYLLDLHRVVLYLNTGDELHLANNFVFLWLPRNAEAFRTSVADFVALAVEAACPTWEVGEGAGFTTAKPWLPLVADAEHLCVERQAADPRSMLTLARRLAAVRARTPVLHSGAQRTVDAGADVFAWLREGEGERLLAAMNFATDAVPFRPLTDMPRRAALVLSSDPDRADREVDPNGFVLRPSEAVLLRLKEEA